jgi:hypothetical protein
MIELTPEQKAAHRISWFVKAGDEWIPRTKSMGGTWGYDAKCSCGWESRTGGAVERHVRRCVDDHKFDVKYGLWENTAADSDA